MRSERRRFPVTGSGQHRNQKPNSNMKTVTSGNIAAAYSYARGSAGRDNLPALIGRIIAVGALVASVAVVRVIHIKPATVVTATLRLPSGYLAATYDLGRSGVCPSTGSGRASLSAFGGTYCLQPILDRGAGKGGC